MEWRGDAERGRASGRREVSFAYDVLARRLTKQVFETKGAERPLKEVRWSWDGHTPLTELDSDEGKTTWVFEPETFNPLAKLAQGQVWGVLTDQIGTPTELIAQDGSVAWRGEIDTYGKMVSEIKRTKCPFRWPGQMEDDEGGLSYNRFRCYENGVGRYLSEDPLCVDGGISVYGYVRDPLGEVDPLGLASKPAGGCTSTNSGPKDEAEMAEELAQQINRNRVGGRTAGGRIDIDLRGKSHFDKASGQRIPIPHVHEAVAHAGPSGLSSLGPKTTRPATKNDVRMARELARRQGLL